MVRVVRKENNKPIHVAICGIKSAVFAQYQQELQGIGYQLSFEPNVQEAGRVSGSDICIVDISALEPSNQQLQNKNLIFDEIKTVSRHKQQRVSDVANKIIHSLSSEITSTEKKKIKPKPICNLTLWLEENIFNKNRK